MGTYLTDAGFVRPTLAEIVTQLGALFSSVGLTDSTPDGPVGQVIAGLALRESTIWEDVGEVVTARDKSTATGVSLDNLFGEIGFKRLQASATTVNDATLYGTQDAVVPSGAKARLSAATAQTYSLDADVTITQAAFAEIQLDPSKGLGVYTVVLDGTSYSLSIAANVEKDAVIDAMIPVIQASPKWGADRIDGPLLRIRPGIGQTAGVLGSLVGFSLKKLGSYGDFTGDTTGAISCPAGALNEISTTVTGWTGVYNRSEGTIGRAAESDDEFRLRAESGFHGGLGTDAAILATLYADVDGLTSAGIVSNRTDNTVDSIPKKSFEVTVVGGTDAAVAAAIWKAMPSGMESFGSEIDTTDGKLGILLTDSQGYKQRVYFSRPTALYIWVKASVRLSTEEAYPSEWQAAIRTAILDQAGDEIKPGKDVVFQNLFKAIYKVAGIDFVDLYIGSSTDGAATAPDAWLQPKLVNGVWEDEKIPVSGRQYATFSSSRIALESLA